jgi:hypothetical protein
LARRSARAKAAAPFAWLASLRSLVSVVVTVLAIIVPLAAQQVPPSAGQPGAVSQRPPDLKGTAAIRGRVVAADTGRPLRAAQIVLANVVTDAAAASPTVRRSAYADAQGRFGWDDLPAGKYRVTATTFSGYCSLEYGADAPGEAGTVIAIADGEAFDKADFRLPRGGVVTGRVVDDAGEPVQGVAVDAYALEYRAGVERLRAVTGGATRSKASNDVGEYRIFGLPPGDYYIAASPAPFGARNSTRDLSAGFAVTYYPGTTAISEAQRVSVAAAGEVEASYSLVPSATFEVAGVALDASGAPLAGAALSLRPAENPMPTMDAAATTARDGSFTFASVPAGRYILQTIRSPGGRWAFISTALTIASDTKSLVVQAKAPVTAAGQVVFDAEVSPFTTTGVRIAAWPVDPLRSPLVGGDTFEAPERDGTFHLSDLWGPRQIVVEVPPGWGVKSVRLNGADVTDKPIDFERERDARLEVALTNRTTHISGVVADDGRPAAKATVLIFSSDRTRWSFTSRFLRASATDETGRYTVSGLPAGEYRAIALPNAPYGWQRAQVLDPLIRDGSRVTLNDGERATLDLKIVKVR